MTIDEKKNDDLVILSVHGRVEAINSEEFQNRILKAFQGNKNVVLDMSDVPYISSAGLRALLIGNKTASSKGGKLIISSASAAVKEMIRVTGFDRIFEIQ